MADPFTEANAALWNALLASDEFVGLVSRTLNRMSTVPVTGTTTTNKFVNRAPADVPEVLITQRGVQPAPAGRNSKTFDASQTYTIQIIDTKLDVTRLNQVKWATLKALATAARQSPPFGLTFLKGMDWLPGTEGRALNADNQQVGEWVAVCDVRFDFAWGVDELA